VQQISAYDTPAYTSEQVPLDVFENLVDPEWVKTRKQVWGTKDPRYIAGEIDIDPLDAEPPSSWRSNGR
jgi:hypothetical protein